MGVFVSKIIVVGVGLIGGSLACAAKKRNIAETVIGVDSSPEHLRLAEQRGIIDRSYTNLADALEFAFEPRALPEVEEKPGDTKSTEVLLVICTPVGTVAKTIIEAVEYAGDRSLLITDVGSTKHSITWQIRGKLPKNVRYLGSHPISGSEKSGPQNADADLFVGRLTVLTPLEEEEPVAISGITDVGFLEQFWNLLGSSVIQIPPGQHDSILAKTSHLPHLLSVMLVQSLSVDEHYLVGPGFRDMSRLASGNPALWTDIFANNKDAILDTIQIIERLLADFHTLLEEDRYSEIFQLLENVKNRRDSLEKLAGNG